MMIEAKKKKTFMKLILNVILKNSMTQFGENVLDSIQVEIF